MNDMVEPCRNVDLHADLSGEEAVRRIGRSCLKLIKHHEILAVQGRSDGVHQIRVSIRRLRSALSSFRKSFPRDQYKWIQRELRWIADVLGEARDLDVFETSLLEKARDSFGDDVSLVKLPVQDAKHQAYDAVYEAIRSPRYHALKHGLERWFEEPAYGIGSGYLGERLYATVPGILDRRYKKAIKLTKDYQGQSDKARHRLRIALKKLRYTSELFGVIYKTKPVEEFTHRLKRLQDDLGDENDVRTGRKLFERVAQGCSPNIQSAGNAILDWHEKRVADHENRTVRHLERLIDTLKFWA